VVSRHSRPPLAAGPVVSARARPRWR
jgi:hypothetical protein